MWSFAEWNGDHLDAGPEQTPNDMKLAAVSIHAVCAVAYIASNQENGPVPAKEIAEMLKIPHETLLKTLQQLARWRILKSKRGRHGGFLLLKSAHSTTLLEIPEVTEGPFNANLSVERPADCSLMVTNRLESVVRDALVQVKGLLCYTTVSHLIANSP